VAELKVQRRNETLLVLGVSLGASGIYAVVRIIDRLTRTVPLNQQTAQLNPSLNARPWLDLTYQLLGIFFALVPVFLAVHLLNREPGDGRGLLGLDRDRWRFDVGMGALLAAVIGIPGLGLYVLGNRLGFNVDIVATGLPEVWWGVPVLILAAIQNAVLEEVIVVGYLVTRLRQLDWGIPAVLAASAILRGSYHLYQGFGGFIGNAVMGVLFALVFLRWKRTTPLIVAHSILDIVAFVGYALLAVRLDWI
jgi:membrane protease YdiL (CAAX protease family)